MQSENSTEILTDKRLSRNTIFELFLLSFISLYVELLIIRWMSADIRAFTVFHTFPLITCFVGMGVGFAMRRDDAFRECLPAIFVFAFFMKLANFIGICFWGFPSGSNFQWQNLVGLAQINWAYLMVFACIIILLLAGPFAMCVCIGARLGVLFNQLKPLPAYCYNVGGAIAGSIAFPLLCYFGCPPWVLLMSAAVAISGLLLFKKDTKLNIKNFGIIAILVPMFLFVPEETSKPLVPELLQARPQHEVLWSPYQRLDLTTFHAQAETGQESIVGLELSANRAFYQYFFPLQADSSGMITNLTNLRSTTLKDYLLPLSLNKPQSVLIVGAGTGQNVTSAVEAGLTDIDAVEIDPVILQVGKKFNSDYANPNVHAICDDARHYFSRCQKKYDLVNFATLDSHAVSGLGSSVRLDAYVYTRESMKQALSLLKPGGVVVCSFVAMEPWIEKRLVKTFTEAAGYPPLLTKGVTLGRIFVLGDGVRDKTLKLPDGYPDETVAVSVGGTEVLTDDWPYLYVRNDVVDWTYLLVVGEIVLLSLYAARRFIFKEQDPSSWQMFFLGSAFIILELHAISFLSLVYGSTWITSAIVINGILIMILIANAAVFKFSRVFDKYPFGAYAALIGSIFLSFFMSSNSLLHIDTSMAALLTAVTLLPMGLAAIIFGTSINASPNLSKALAFNLFGAVLGGLLEYLSNYWGIKSLLFVSAFFYCLSALCLYKHLKQPAPAATQK